MSVQFGKWSFDGRPIDPEDLEEVRPVLAPYGPDGEGFICRDNCAVLYRAFYTTKESRREQQPFTSESGAVITWDGRLDNREELMTALNCGLSPVSTDIDIVAACYERWGTKLFSKLIGDWALSVWDHDNRSLILAKDFVGTRHLYYSISKDQVTWCTILDPLVLFAKHPFNLDKEYVGGWLSFFPAANLTPYIGVHSVEPSTFVRIARGTATVNRYWGFDPAKRIRYQADGEYQEHFRYLFSESVRRRLRSDKPVLAELSGGMDSSSIVCVADQMLSRGIAEAPRVNTVSYYDDSEPNWNERPFFTQLEQQRGQIGCHIDISNERSFAFSLNQFAATPAFLRRCSQEESSFADCVRARDNRVVLSGIGGDEVTGGQPSPSSELADYLSALQFRTLAHQLTFWSLNKRQPWFHLLLRAARNFFVASATLREFPSSSILQPDFVRRNRNALLGYPQRWTLFGGLPSFQESLLTLKTLQRQLACSPLARDPAIEMRYPYLDRCLLEFLYAIPREQLLRPGQRRSLMRRALYGVVPKEILDRRRKAYSTCAPRAIIAYDGATLVRGGAMCSVLLGIVDPNRFAAAIEEIRLGHDAALVPILRFIVFESWLQSLAHSAPSLLQCQRLAEPCIGSRSQLSKNPNLKGGENSELFQAEDRAECSSREDHSRRENWQSHGQQASCQADRACL
jgi:asparagine synthase (glutamine-hydrolysing)